MVKTKLEVQVRACFCCSLTAGIILIAIYTIILFGLLIGLAVWGLTRSSDITQEYYRNCTAEAKAVNHKCQYESTAPNGTLILEVRVCDAASYHCSLGLYTEELKYEAASTVRKPVLILNIVLWGILILCAILMLIGICVNNEFLLLPWLIFMALEIIRGIISVIFIFVFSYGNLTRIAVGIFFLGVQIFHISLMIIVIAKFQRIRAKKRPVTVAPAEIVDPTVYPTVPSQAAYSTMQRRDGYYQPGNGTLGRQSTDNRYGTYGGRSTMGLQ